MSETLVASGLVRAIGLALVEFVWQGAAIGAASAVLLFVLRRSAPQWRYIVACAGLAAMAIAPVATTVRNLRDPGWAGSRSSKAGAEAAGAFLIPTTATDPSAGGGFSESAGPSRQWLEQRLPFVVAGWTSGVAVLALHLSFGWFRLRRIRAQAILLAVERWPAAVHETARRFGVTRLRLLVSSVVDGPAVIGFVRPAIVVPASALAGLSPSHLEAILIHELAHLRRGDYLVNVVQCGVEILLFYHPAVWWVSNQIRREREHCCDDVAASLSADRLTYARALTSLEELRLRSTKLAVGAGGGELLHRIRRVLAPNTVERPRVSGGFAMSVVAAVITLLALNAQAARPSIPATQSAISFVRSVPAVAAHVASPAAIARPAAPAVTRPEPSVPPRRAPTAISGAPSQVPQPRDQAQGGVGSLAGVVRDQTGGVIPGARVSVTSVDATIAPTITTGTTGEFVVTDLPAGAYTLAVSLPGFATSRNMIQIRAGQTVSVIVRLDIGGVTETVTVAASTYARAATPARQVPANPQTASDYFDAAKILYEQGKMAESAEMITRAQQLLRASQPETPIEVSPEPVQAATGTSPTAPIRVGGSIKEPRKIRHVPPIYPAAAAAAGIDGVVVVEAVIAKDGSVKELNLLRSVPALDEAVVGAVQQWLFTPTLLNGVPVEVMMTVTVHFAAR
jgi:TonB family protein